MNWSGEDRSLAAITEPMLRVRRVLLDEFERLDRLCRQLARRDTVCLRLMTFPGVGTVVALTYRTGIDAPERFSRSRDVGAHFGLTPRRFSSGQTDYDGRISCCGYAMVRTALYQAAHVLLHHGRWSSLRSWAMRIAKRSSVKAAKVALARRLAVVMHRMWVDGTDFRWSDGQGNSTITSTETNLFTSSAVAAEKGRPEGCEGRMSPHRWLRQPGRYQLIARQS